MRSYTSKSAKLRIALGHMRHVIASKVVSTWRIRAAELAQRKRRVLGAALLWSHHTQASAFRAWVQHIAIKRAEMQQVEFLCSNTVICSYSVTEMEPTSCEHCVSIFAHTGVCSAPPMKMMPVLRSCFFTLH
jgi:hypothetical protein